MKKTISLLLCLSIMLCIVPGSSFADTLVYEYPPVNAFLAPRDLSAMEMEFRQRAAKLIYMWWSQNRAYAAESDSTIEYCRLADTKVDFDGKKDDDNVYNWNNMSQSEKDGFFLWVFLESVKENMYLDLNNILSKYNNVEKDNRRYWMYDPNTGELVYDSYSEQAQNLSDAERNANWAKAASDVVISTVSTVSNYYIVTKGANDDLSDIFDIIFDSIDSAVEQWIEALKTNNEIRVSNQVRSQLEADLQEAVLTTSDAMIAHLREAYIDTPNPAFQYSTWASDYPTMIRTFVETVEKNRSSYNADLNKATIERMNAPDVSAVFDAIEYNFVDTLDWKQIGTIVLFSAAKEVVTGLIDYVFQALEKEIKEMKLSDLTISWNLFQATCMTISSLAKSAAEDYLEDILRNAKEGKSFPTHVSNQLWGAVVSKILDLEEFKKEFIKQWGKEITGALSEEEFCNKLQSIVLKQIFDIGMADSFESKTQKIGKMLFKVGGHEIDESITNKMLSTINGKTKEMQVSNLLSQEGSEKINELDEKIYNLKQKLQKANVAFDTVIKVWDRWWETGISIQAALESTVAAETGEGVMSMLGSRMVTCTTMRRPMRTNIISAIVVTGSTANETVFTEYFMNPEKISAEDIFTIISQIYLMNQYDIVGSAAYFNMVLHCDVFYKQVLFVSQKAKFLKYIEQNHINRLGQKGLLSIEYATADYNNFVTYGTYYTLPEQWYILFEH